MSNKNVSWNEADEAYRAKNDSTWMKIEDEECRYLLSNRVTVRVIPQKQKQKEEEEEPGDCSCECGDECIVQ